MRIRNRLSMSLRVTTVLCAAIVSAPIALANPDSLVLWNKLGSVPEIETSEVGLNGMITGGGFGPGMFGGAYRADFTQDLEASFPKEVIPIDAGAIEFWGRIEGFTTNVYWGPNPHFFQFVDPGRGGWHIGLNGNNGGGLGGITASAGQFGAATGGFFFPNQVPYEQFLGVGQAEDFHHYALVWDKNGIPGVDNGTRKVVVFLDGQLDSMGFVGGPDILPIIGGQLDLILIGDGQAPTLGTEVVLIDNLKIYDFAKTDFSDRFEEGCVVCPDDPDPSSQGYWYHQCLGVPASEGGIDPGRNGRGPQSPTEPNFVPDLMDCGFAGLEDAGLFGLTTCDGMDADPPSDPCQRAEKQLTALILNVCSGKLGNGCEVDVSAEGCSSTNVGDLIEEIAGLIQSGDCNVAKSCAAAVNEGDALVE